MNELKSMHKQIENEYLQNPIVLEYYYILERFLKPLNLEKYLVETLKFMYILEESEFENYIFGDEITEKGDGKFMKPNSGRKYKIDILAKLVDLSKVLVFRITNPRKKDDTNPEDWWSCEVKWIRNQMLSTERSNVPNVLIIASLGKIIENSPLGISTIHDDTMIPGIKRVGNFNFLQSLIIREVDINTLNKLLK